MQCRKAVGPTWGFTPKTMKWIYTAVVRPSLSYGAVIWINGLKTKKNITLLNSVQRLANILISGALPSSPGNALNKINDIIPIDNWIEEEALKGTLRLKANGHWIRMPMVLIYVVYHYTRVAGEVTSPATLKSLTESLTPFH